MTPQTPDVETLIAKFHLDQRARGHLPRLPTDR